MLRSSLINLMMSCLLTVNLAGQWTMTSSITVTPPPPPPVGVPWAGILDSSRAIDWSHAGVQGGIPNYSNDCGAPISPTGIRDWEPNKAYNAGDKISDTPLGNTETVTVAGTSGATEPAWTWTAGDTITDGGVTWTLSIGGTDSAIVSDRIIDCDGQNGVVHLTAGHFIFTGGIAWNYSFHTPRGRFSAGQYTRPVNNVVLRGAGPMQTYLHFPRVGCSSADICVMASTQSFSATNGAAIWLGTGSTLNAYPKGATRLISGSWAPAAPSNGDVVLIDQNSDAFSICPATPPIPPADPRNCTIPGATANGDVATIVTTIPTGYHVGDCIALGDVGARGNLTRGFNTYANPNKTACPPLRAWQAITAIGCIVSGSFVDQANCGGNPLVALQFNAGQQKGTCPINIGTVANPVMVDCLSDTGDGQVVADTGGVFTSHVGSATAQPNSQSTQNARVCPGTTGSPNPACLPEEISLRKPLEMKTIQTATPGGQGNCIAPAGGWCFDMEEPLYLPNWRASQRPGMFWLGAKCVGDGLEDFTYLTENNLGSGTQSGIAFRNARNGWVRNVRTVRINRNSVLAAYSSHITIADNFISGAIAGAETSYSLEDNAAADNLVINNICLTITNCVQTQTTTGRVMAYNYASGGAFLGSASNGMSNLTNLSHLVSLYGLMEGNNSTAMASDNIHGTGGVSTGFRNRLRGQDMPTKLMLANTGVVPIGAFNRGMNAIGNVTGTPGTQARYSTGPQGATGFVWMLDNNAAGVNGGGSDPLVFKTLMRWGNYDSVTGVTRWCGTGQEGSPDCTCGQVAAGTPPNSFCEITAEVPTQSYPFLAAVPIPATHNLPASFFLGGQPAFWTTAWGTPAWPPIGPDVNAIAGSLNSTCAVDLNATTTGPGTFYQCDGLGNHTYQIPAQICFVNSPLDTQFLTTFPVIGGGWGNISGVGNFITLNLNNTGPNAINATSPRTVTVVVSGVTPNSYNGIYLLKSATATSIQYWKLTDPGPYSGGGTITAGTVTSPLVKQFDARTCYPNEGIP